MATRLADRSLAGVPEFRTEIGLSQTALAERVGLSRPTLAKIENGDPTRFSTINFLLTRLQEEFGELFETLKATEEGLNTYRLSYVRRMVAEDAGRRSRPLEWAGEFDALARRIMEISKPRNAGRLAEFHGELIDILEVYVDLTGLEIHLPAD